MGTYLGKDEITEAIDNKLRTEYENNKLNRDKCAILIGPKNSGKTTIMKQFYFTQIMANNNNDNQINNDIFGDIDDILNEIIKNCIATICTLSELIPDDDQNNFRYHHRNKSSITNILKTNDEMDLDIIKPIIIKLWKTKKYKQSYALKNLLAPQLPDNMDFFLDKIDEIMDTQDRYSVTDEDHVMYKTSNHKICRYHGNLEGINGLHLVDFGDMMPRSKRLGIFENVDGIIFVSALSDYCVYKSDESKDSGHNVENMMEHSFKMFEELCGLKWFKETKFHLILTKFDILRNNLRNGISLSELFGDEWDSNNDYKNRKLALTIDHLTRMIEDDNPKITIPMVIGQLIKEYLIDLNGINGDDEIRLNNCASIAVEFIKDKYVNIYEKYSDLHDHPLNIDWYPTVSTNLCLMRATLWSIRCNLYE